MLTHGIFAVVTAAAAGTCSAGEVPFAPQPPLMSAVTAGVRDAPAADIDGDADLDVVASASSGPFSDSNQLLWLENVAGDGSAWSTHTIATWSAGGHYRVVTGDVDGDGDVDIVASLDAGPFEVSLLWWENGGHGTSWERHNIGAAALAPLAVGDIDRDGDLDIAANEGGPVWYQNASGDGTIWNGFAIATQQLQLRLVPLADLDGDGDLDTVGRTIFGEWFWYENNGSGQGWAPHPLMTSLGGAIPNAMGAADMDRDGDLDLFTSLSGFNGTVEWLENPGGPTLWVRHTIGTANFAWAVTAADLDGDGDIDGLAAEQGSDQVIWYENLDGAAGSWTAHPIGTLADGALSLEVPDLDGDGDVDILAPASDGGDVRWLKNVSLHGNACFTTGVPIARAPVTSVSSADFDGDGDRDALAAPPVVWHENVGDGVSWVEHAVPGAAGESAWPVDRDRDGDPDVVQASRAQDRVSWFANGAGGSAWTEHVIATALDGPSFAIAADLLQDGHSDVVTTSPLADRVTWHREVFGGFWTTQAISTTADGAQCVAAADMDRDGDLDVVSASSNDATVAWYENTFPGPVPWLPHVVSTATPGAASVEVADVDHDGDPDLVGAAAQAGRVAWFENIAGNGTTWTDRTIATGAVGVTSVTSADLDRDGDVDVVSTSPSDNRVAWHENVAGNGTGWTTRTVTSQAPGAASATAVDFDRDGRTDVLSGSSGGVAWHPNRGGQFSLSAIDQSPDTALNGTLVALLRVDAAHLGRPADRDLELARLGLRLESPDGPLTPQQANAVIETLRVYADANANAVFDEGTDVLVVSEGRLQPIAGVLTLPFADGQAAVQLSTGSTRTYFLVVELASDASMHEPRRFRMVHLGLGASASGAEDRDHDIPLRPACAVDVVSGLVTTMVPVELTTFTVE